MKEDKAELNGVPVFAQRQPVLNSQARRYSAPNRIKVIGRMVAINVLVLAALLLIVEAVFGSWLNPSRLNRLNLIRSTIITSSASGLYTHNPSTILYRRDAFALRGNYPAPDRIDILTIGGSTTDQRYITEGETWQDVLAQEFGRHGKGISVVNAGVDGQSTFGHIKDFDWWFPSIPKLHARYFLFYIGINDFYIQDSNRYDELVNPNSITGTIRENSAVYYLYRTLRGVYQAQVVAQVAHRAIDFGALHWTNRGLVADHDALMHPRVDRYRERLKILGEKVRAFGGVPICVTQTERKFKRAGNRILGDAEPFKYGEASINGVDQYELMHILNQVTLESCSAIGGIGVDLASELEFEDADFYDFIHNTPRGAAKVGSYLYAKLKDQL